MCGVWTARRNTSSHATESGDKHELSDMGSTNDKACHGDE